MLRVASCEVFCAEFCFFLKDAFLVFPLKNQKFLAGKFTVMISSAKFFFSSFSKLKETSDADGFSFFLCSGLMIVLLGVKLKKS